MEHKKRVAKNYMKGTKPNFKFSNPDNFTFLDGVNTISVLSGFPSDSFSWRDSESAKQYYKKQLVFWESYVEKFKRFMEVCEIYDFKPLVKPVLEEKNNG